MGALVWPSWDPRSSSPRSWSPPLQRTRQMPIWRASTPRPLRGVPATMQHVAPNAGRSPCRWTTAIPQVEPWISPSFASPPAAMRAGACWSIPAALGRAAWTSPNTSAPSSTQMFERSTTSSDSIHVESDSPPPSPASPTSSYCAGIGPTSRPTPPASGAHCSPEPIAFPKGASIGMLLSLDLSAPRTPCVTWTSFAASSVTTS